MLYKNFNANPSGKRVSDCVIRALSKAMNKPWECILFDLCMEGLTLCDLPNANAVWGKYLQDRGWQRDIMPNSCSACYTVYDFCSEHPNGTYILALDGHVVAVIDGYYYDTFDSGDRAVLFYWSKKEY